MQGERRTPRNRFLAALAAPIILGTVLGAGALPAHADDTDTGGDGSATSVAGYPLHLNGGSWPTSHVQGIAVDEQNGFVYYSFTTLIVKSDLEGNILGTMGGFNGHLGDLDFNPEDGRVYGSLEYKGAESFYIAVIDVDKITELGMTAQNSDIFQTVYLKDVVADFTADMDGDGDFDGNIANTPDHRYGSSGIDGVSFGPKFGQTDGEQYLTVAHGIYSNVTRTDNDNQVLLQYDVSDWADYEAPLIEETPHQSGPDDVSGKYFVYTGNTTYGVQNLEYDAYLQRWFMGVYRGSKPAFPNYSLYAVDAATQPQLAEVPGQGGEQGMMIALADDGLVHAATGIRGWNQKADVGIASLGNGLYYLSRNSASAGLQTSDLTLSRWTGDPAKPFAAFTTPAAPAADTDELTGLPAGGVTVTRAGTDLTVTVPGAGSDDWVYVHAYSDATPLGWFQVSDVGTIAVNVASQGTGTIRLAITAADGAFLGWVKSNPASKK